jgi:hypothetical protein
MIEDPFGNFKKGNEFKDDKIINAKIIRKILFNKILK